MAVYTHLSQKALSALLETHYSLPPLISYQPIAEGIENSNYLITCENKISYIFTIFEKRAKAEDIPFYLSFMNHLAAENFPAPKPIKTKTENWCGEISGKTFALVSFLSGKSIVKPQAAHMKELGHFTAKMHKAGENFQANRQNNFDLNSLQKLANSLADSLDKIDENLFALVSDTLNHCKNNWPNNLPRGLIHADLFPDNVFFLDKNLSGVIDFYFACTDIYAYELAICLNAWCFENSTWNANLAQNFLDHYHSERKLSAAEWNALPLLMRGGAIRFLLTRTQDFSQKKEQEALVHHKDPKEYSAKLYFHHQRKNLSDYGLSARA